MVSDFASRLEKIRVQFLFDHPFLSVLALSLPLVFRENPHEAMETNGSTIFIDESRCVTFSDQRLKYIYAHILLHIILKHAFRMKGREAATWNRSCDIVINLLLSDFERIGERPDDEILLEKFRDQSVEAVYHALYRPEEEHEGTPDDKNPTQEKRDLIENEGDEESAEEDINASIVQAMGAARKQGNLPASFLTMIDEVIKPKIDLETLLHTYMTESFFEKQSDFMRPSRRFIHQGLYLPGYKKEKSRIVLYIALDRSMSISPEVFGKFLGIIDGVLSMGTEHHVCVVPFDMEVDEEKVVCFESGEEKPPVAFEKSDGGTQFQPVVEYLHSHATHDAMLMVLSDGYFRIEEAPPCETLFLLSDKKRMELFKGYGDVFYFDL